MNLRQSLKLAEGSNGESGRRDPRVTEDHSPKYIQGISEDVQFEERVKAEELEDHVGEISHFDEEVKREMTDRTPFLGDLETSLHGCGDLFHALIDAVVIVIVVVFVCGEVGFRERVRFGQRLHVLVEMSVEQISGVFQCSSPGDRV